MLKKSNSLTEAKAEKHGSITYYINPSSRELKDLLKNTKYRTARIAIEADSGKDQLYFWDAYGPTHNDVYHKLGIEKFWSKDKMGNFGPKERAENPGGLSFTLDKNDNILYYSDDSRATNLFKLFRKFNSYKRMIGNLDIKLDPNEGGGYWNAVYHAEEAPTVSAGSGAVASIGIGPDGEPGVNNRKKKSKLIRRAVVPKAVNETSEMFAGSKCFSVDDDRFHKCRLGKAKYAQYKSYVGEDEIGQSIREYGISNPNSPIIVKNSKTGAMLYLKYGKGK